MLSVPVPQGKFIHDASKRMVPVAGIEPTTLRLWGVHSKPAELHRHFQCFFLRVKHRSFNISPSVELSYPFGRSPLDGRAGTHSQTWTDNFFHVKEALYQLSYASINWHGRRDSNPHNGVLEGRCLSVRLLPHIWEIIFSPNLHQSIV